MSSRGDFGHYSLVRGLLNTHFTDVQFPVGPPDSLYQGVFCYKVANRGIYDIVQPGQATDHVINRLEKL